MERIKKAHLKRAKEMYDDPSVDTPGSFEEFFSTKYVDEYGKGNKKKDPNSKVIERYKGYLANTRKEDKQDTPGLLGKVQMEGKGPYPANQEEDEHVLAQALTFLHSDQIQDNIYKLLETSPDNLASVIAETGANMAAKLIFEIRKQREVTEEMESSLLTIAIEELWTMAKNMGMKQIDGDIVKNSIRVGSGMYNELEKQLASKAPAQKVTGLEGQPQGEVAGGQPAPQQGGMV